MIQQTVNWVSKLPVQDEKCTHYMRQSTNPSKDTSSKCKCIQRLSEVKFFYGMFYGWESLQQPEGGRHKILKVNTNYHVSCLSQKKCRLVPTIKSKASCCIPAARAGTHDHGGWVPEEQHFATKQTRHKQSPRTQICFSYKKHGTTDRPHNYRHDTSFQQENFLHSF